MTDVTLRKATSINFLRANVPEARAYMADNRVKRFWARALERNQDLFDGEIVIAHALEWREWSCSIYWDVITFSTYLWSRSEEAKAFAIRQFNSLFVSVVVQTQDGFPIFGRMGQHTSAPGQIQLPGGNIDPPIGSSMDIDIVHARTTAARELFEEIGLCTDPTLLRPWAIKERGHKGDIGVMFRLPRPIKSTEIVEAYGDVRRRSNLIGSVPEFSALGTVELADHTAGGNLSSGHLIDYTQAVFGFLVGVCGAVTFNEWDLPTSNE